jgi:hypothetical protein
VVIGRIRFTPPPRVLEVARRLPLIGFRPAASRFQAARVGTRELDITLRRGGLRPRTGAQPRLALPAVAVTEQSAR